MPLSPGVRLGPYEVTAAIGAGGMGEVYRGRDAALNRDVAIKVLPAGFSSDPERVARFKREAQVLASLNHPNIAHVYGFEGASLPDGSTVHFLAMELVEGEDLSARLRRGAIPVDEAIAIAKHIAEGLEEAHEHGIIHRDLKPANVKVAPDGKVKVLDFGLAKALEGDASSGDRAPDVSHSPTLTRAETSAGIIVGTAAYMSPEQARGKKVDKRADIWSFGVVLYEMLTGNRLFAGETVTDILAAVLTKDPDWRALPAGTPEAAQRALMRCLVRDPRNRLRDLGEMRLAFDGSWVREGAVPFPSTPAPGPRPVFLAAAAALLLGGALIGAALLGSWKPASDAIDAPTHVAVTLPPETRLALGRGSSVALSPDGRRVAYTAVTGERTRLYLHDLDRPSAVPLDGTDGAMDPFFSPDGQWIGFFSDGKIRKVALSGGAPVDIGQSANPRGETWGPDDVMYIVPGNASPILRLSARDGSPQEPATKLAAGEASHRWPALYAEGRGLLYSVWNNTGWEGARIAARTPEGATRDVVAAGGGYPKVLRDLSSGRSYLIYARADGLLVAPFDERRSETTGPALPLLDGVVTNLSGGAQFDVSPAGVLAYAPGLNAEKERTLAWVSRDGTATPLPGTHGAARYWSLSDDGRRIVRHTAVGARAIWVDDLESPTQQRVVQGDLANGGIVTWPLWVGSRNAIVYSQGAPAPNLVIQGLGPGDGPVQLTRSDRSQAARGVSADGRTLLYQEAGGPTAGDLMVLTLPPPGREVTEPMMGTPFLQTPASEVDGSFSPDGKWVVYVANGSGRFEVFVAAFPSGEPQIQVSTDSGYEPQFVPGGHEIVFRNERQWLMSATFSVQDGRPLAGRPTVLADTSKYEMNYSVSPDGKRFLMMPLLPTEGDATDLRLILNVGAEIRRRMPEAGGRR